MDISREELYRDLPFISIPENVAWYQDGKVRILDRRVYPFETRFEICENYHEVTKAIRDMVTQSGGPYHAAACGMILAADEAAGRSAGKQKEIMRAAAAELGSARPTNNGIRTMAAHMLEKAEQAIDRGAELKAIMREETLKTYDELYFDAYRLGKNMASLLASGDGILTHCWPDVCLIYGIRAAKDEGKKLRAFCDETRPYLQGARLTAKAVSDMGVPTTVLCDGMAAHVMGQGGIRAFFTGTDRVTMDGWVFNKIGTLQTAIAAKHFGIPYYPLCHQPDRNAPTKDAVIIEERDPEEVLHCRGVRTAAPGVSGYYPAFDATPPELVRAVVTGRGIFAPDRLWDFYRE